MTTAIAIAVIVLGSIAWLGQAMSALSPPLAARLGLMEPREDVDPAFFADARGEAIWDALTTWTLPLSGVLLLLDHPWWPGIGLAGGGIYVYFAGRGIVSRILLRRQGIRIGSTSTYITVNVALVLWGLSGAAMIALAAGALCAS